MPRYDYHCKYCDYTIEVIHPMDECDTKEVTCNVCGGSMCRQIGHVYVSGVNIYPFTLKTIRPRPEDGKIINNGRDVIIESKTHHKEVMERHNSVSEATHGSKAQDYNNA
jgi:putative FmdB family regulatory protein